MSTVEAEIWKNTDYPDYQVSNFGRVRSLKNGSCKILSQSGSRYNQLKLYNNGVFNNIKVHKLVALAFVPNPENKPVVDHINRDKLDNRASNLRWVTQQDNCRNSSLSSANTTGCTGVSFYNNRWYARIMVDRKKIHLGTFATYSDAIDARMNAEVLYFNKHKD